MVQLSDLVRVTRGQAAELAFHFEAVARVEAEHTDDWLVHRSGDERPLAKFSRRVSLSTPTSGVGLVSRASPVQTAFATVREMKEGPSSPTIRCWSQATASCCGQKPWW